MQIEKEEEEEKTPKDIRGAEDVDPSSFLLSPLSGPQISGTSEIIESITRSEEELGPMIAGGIKTPSLIKLLKDFFSSTPFAASITEGIENKVQPHKLTWKDGEPRGPFAKLQTRAEELPEDHSEAIEKDLQEGLENGTFSEIDNSEARIVCKVRGEQQESKIRVIHVLCPVNEKLREEACSVSYEDIRAARLFIHPFMSKMDLKQGYRNIPVHHSDRAFLCFSWKGTTYQTNVLPFGLASAPKAFTDMLKGLGVKWRIQGSWVIIYLDDILISAPTFEEWHTSINLVYSDLKAIGLRVNLKKLFVGPFRRIEFLGTVLDYESQSTSVSDKKIEKAMKLIEALQKNPNLENLERFLGFLSFLSVGVRGTRLFRRAMDNCLSAWKTGAQPDIDEALTEASFWKDNLRALRGKKVTRESLASQTIYTDASGTGWGAALTEKGKAQRVFAGNLSEKERKESSTARELVALRRTLEKLQPSDKTFVWFSDNTAAVSSVQEKSARAAGTLSEMRKIVKILTENNLDILPVHCGREFGFIPLCDEISKGKMSPNFGRFVPPPGNSTLFPPRDQTEWEIGHSVFNADIRPLLSHDFIDTFATPNNRKSPRFCSKIDCFESLGNGLALDWTGETIYAFPPFSLCEAVLQKTAQSKAKKVILITKDISTDPLWTIARSLTTAPPQILRKRKGLLFLNGMPGEAAFDLLLWTF